MREEHRDFVDLEGEELLDSEARYLFCFGERRSVLERKIREQPAPGSNDELSRFASGRDVECFVSLEFDRLPKQIRVERPGQSLVGAQHDNQLVLYLTLLEE